MSDDSYGQPFRDAPRLSFPESYRSIGPAFEKLCHASTEQNEPEQQKTSSESQSQCPPTPSTPISPPTCNDPDSDSGDFCYARPLVFNDFSQNKDKSNSNQNQNRNQGSDICQDLDGGNSLKIQGSGSKSNECESGESASSPVCPNCGFGRGGGTCSFPEPELGKCQAVKIDWNPSLSKKLEECAEEIKPKSGQEDCEETPQKPPDCESEEEKERGKLSSQKKQNQEECLNRDDDIFSRNRKWQPSKPAPQQCEKFINFAKGIPDPDPRPSIYDNRKDEVYDCIMSSLSEKDEEKRKRTRETDAVEKEVEDENAAKVRYRINSMTSICPLSDSTKSDKFEAPGEGFRCPPMPNNVPLLMAPVYLQKPNEITVPAYPAPPGVKIQPMIKGIRTNRERNPHCFTCGAKRKPISKKCFSKNCPAIKTAQPCSKPNEVTNSIKGMVGEIRKTVENLTGFKW